MIIATAGHVDHGKTTLLQAITGINADRLPEEKKRGMTIDLGYAYWPQPDGRVLGFIDVPGHEKFLSNMLAGVGVSIMPCWWWPAMMALWRKPVSTWRSCS